MLTHTLMFLLGLVALVVGAELLVRGASRLALRVGISPLVIGLTVVAFGTSAPELAVSVGAAVDGKADLAIGNVVGSNICNILLILGLCALVTPLNVAAQIIRQEVPIMIAVSILLIVLAFDGLLSFADSALLFALIIAYTWFLIVQSRRATLATQESGSGDMPAAVSGWRNHWAVHILYVAGGLVALVIGAGWLVNAAVEVAQMLGVSDLVIGLTVVAVGTSMPEIATSLVAALRGQRDIAVGNVVGSCIFNILTVLGLTGLIADGGMAVSAAARNFDLWVMLAVAFACLPVMLSRTIQRWEGGVFLAYYVAYTAWLVLNAQHHAVLPAFSTAMLSYVLPLTVITLVVSMLRNGGQTVQP